MKRISCNVYQDILPLYADEVVSQDTREFVEVHLNQCPVCREELRKMARTIDLPQENASKPLEAIRRKWVQKNRLILGLSLALLGAFLLMALPFFDTAMQYHIQGLVGNIEDYWYLLLPMALVSFALEWWFIHLKKVKWLKYIPLGIPTVLLVLSEIAWASGGWDRFGSSLLWWMGFPLLLGSGVAALLKAALDQNRQGRLIIAVATICVIALAAFFWPKRMYDMIQVELDLTMLSLDSEGKGEWRQIHQEELDRLLAFSKITPCAIEPEWDGERCILLRLDENHILMAPYGDAPYIYQYTGPLEDFTGQNVRYRLYHFTALYMELKTLSNLIE